MGGCGVDGGGGWGWFMMEEWFKSGLVGVKRVGGVGGCSVFSVVGGCVWRCNCSLCVAVLGGGF